MMKTHKKLVASALAASLAAFALALGHSPAASAEGAVAQDQPYGALERGYRTGYSDGYQAGWSDQLKGAQSDYRAKADYKRADRAYIAAYGPLDDYRDGYQQGFEVGYGAGFSKQGFDSNIPAGGVRARGATPREAADESNESGSQSARTSGNAGESSSQPRGGTAPVMGQTTSGPGPVQQNVVLTVELLNRLSTDVSQRGDRFQAKVVEPQQFAGAIVGGRLADVQRPGKTRGRALLQLEFDQIQMPGSSDWQEFSALVIEVVPTPESGVGEVDPEGGVRGRSNTKDDVAKVGAASGIGAIIGGIAGGGKGAVIGAIIGGGASTAGVMTQRGKEIRLETGQQLRIRSTSRGR